MKSKNPFHFDPQHTYALFEKLAPDRDQRAGVADIFASLIETAHDQNRAGWQINVDRRQHRLTLSVGKIWVLAWDTDSVALAVRTGFDVSSLPQVSSRKGAAGEYKAVAGVSWVDTTLAAFLERWAELRPGVDAAIVEASKISRTPRYGSCSPGAVRALEQLVGRSLPDPFYLEPSTDRIQELLRLRYPKLRDLSYPAFLHEERNYKVEAVRTAQELLAESVLRGLVAQQGHEEVVERLKTVAQKTNLLWLSVAKDGDLAPLYVAEGDLRVQLVDEIVELLHGKASTTKRLQRWIDWLDKAGLPNKWTFPTYFLFLLAPEHEIFIKPEVTRDFFLALGFDYAFRGRPDPWLYDWSRRLALQLCELLGARDLIDIQSVIYVAGKEGHDLRNGPTTDDGKPHPETLLSAVAAETGLPEALLERWVRAIDRKGQAILYGPPGTGKTFVAEHLAHHLIGGGRGFIETVQFHPSYAYEDFIQGIRPQKSASGELIYDVVPGIFLKVCRRAWNTPNDDRCVLIIDEINRANLSRVFGELMYLLEYRDREVPLPGGGHLKVPANLQILGTMNTADRSIALVDHALRRRFAFLPLRPNFDTLRHFHEQRQTGFPVDRLVEVLRQVNEAIGDHHYTLGISYFLLKDLEEHLEDVWQMEIEPYLEEYFFDQPERADAFRWQKVGAKILR